MPFLTPPSLPLKGDVVYGRSLGEIAKIFLFQFLTPRLFQIKATFNYTIYFKDPAAGASDDWYKGVLNARFSYTVELRDTGFYGFVLPASQIKPRSGYKSLV